MKTITNDDRSPSHMRYTISLGHPRSGLISCERGTATSICCAGPLDFNHYQVGLWSGINQRPPIFELDWLLFARRSLPAT
jgi:hypothetical protein